MFERYTEKARRVIFFARYECSQFGAEYMGTEHLLLGILREDDFVEVGMIIAEALGQDDFESRRADLSDRAAAIAERYPLYSRVGAAGIV